MSARLTAEFSKYLTALRLVALNIARESRAWALIVSETMSAFRSAIHEPPLQSLLTEFHVSVAIMPSSLFAVYAVVPRNRDENGSVILKGTPRRGKSNPEMSQISSKQDNNDSVDLPDGIITIAVSGVDVTKGRSFLLFCLTTPKSRLRLG